MYSALEKKHPSMGIFGNVTK